MLVCRRVSNYYAATTLGRASSSSARSLSAAASITNNNDDHHAPRTSTSPKPDSIFSTKESPWDHVLSDIKDMPPLLPSAVRNPLRTGSTSASTITGGKVVPGRPRRQAMTAREISAFDEMFNMIFNAVSEHKIPSPSPSSQNDPLSIGMGMGIGRKPNPKTKPLDHNQSPIISDLFSKLRKHSKRLKWTTEADEELDKKKEEMELCDTDQQLLEWAMREVFGQSQAYEERARKAIDDGIGAEPHLAFTSGSTPTGTLNSNDNTNTTPSPSPSPSLSLSQSQSQPQPQPQPQSPPDLQPRTYPHLIAHLMRTFRDKYNDPYLSLSIFDYAKHLSIPSYVFGCTTHAYNELVHTRWERFRDLDGVLEALVEMSVNGVEMDGRTRKLVEGVRREVGFELGVGGVGGDGVELEVGAGERGVWDGFIGKGTGEGVLETMAKIERLVIKEPRRKQQDKDKQKQTQTQKKQKHKMLALDAWKGDLLKSDETEDGYEFGHWGSSKTKPAGARLGLERDRDHDKHRDRDSSTKFDPDDWLKFESSQRRLEFE